MFRLCEVLWREVLNPTAAVSDHCSHASRSRLCPCLFQVVCPSTAKLTSEWPVDVSLSRLTSIEVILVSSLLFQ